MNYLNKFKLNKKIAFVLGGSGTIGSETCIALSQAGAKVINIDIVENKILKKNSNIIFLFFNLKNLNNFEKFLKKTILKYGPPKYLLIVLTQGIKLVKIP